MLLIGGGDEGRKDTPVLDCRGPLALELQRTLEGTDDTKRSFEVVKGHDEEVDVMMPR